MPASPAPVVAAVRRFVEHEVTPAAGALEHADAYPHALVARMRELGLFGALVPAAWGGLGLDVSTYARVIEELCRGWMSLAGVINSHTMAALIVLHHGTDEQRARFLPRLAAGECRGGLCLTEPHAGSDAQAIRTVARRRGDEYVIDGTKMFVTNGREGNTFALLAVTEPSASPRHRGMSCFVVEKGHPGLRVAQNIAKLGYKGVDTAELVFDGFAVPAANLVGGVEGRGFKHVMSGLETGRINIAARAVGVAQAAMDAAREHARAAGAPSPALADMAARLEAARLTTYWAAGMKDRQERCDVEAGIAKLLASETAQALAAEALRLHGPAGTLERLPLERYYRDAPLMIIGEGTNEIQRLLIARQVLERYGERLGALTSRDEEDADRRLIVLAVRQFVEKTVAATARDDDAARRFPSTTVRGLADLGILGAVLPPDYGGLGLDGRTWAMLLEEIARGSAALAGVVASHACAGDAIARHGDPGLRERLLPPMTRGELLGVDARGEPSAVLATRAGEEYRLRGSVPLVENAVAAGVFVVSARGGDGREIAVLVERARPGVVVASPEAALGARGVAPAALTLDDVLVPAPAVLDAPADGGAGARVALAASAVGLAQGAFEAALRYSQQRTAFGQPICQHQAIQLKLADMATAITAARLLTYAAADAADADPLLPGLAKVFATEAALTVTLEAMRIHGGYGYTAEFPVERSYRDAPRLALALGGNDHERALLAAALAARE
ncbi:MAG: acyl-CoA dehydrogenase family protein [Candidatus Rokubacteria bacterium]|nr:acyl-CoA dehydrogenase family protein [Candidatus Rokubacteria bacterium]